MSSITVPLGSPVALFLPSALPARGTIKNTGASSIDVGPLSGINTSGEDARKIATIAPGGQLEWFAQKYVLSATAITLAGSVDVTVKTLDAPAGDMVSLAFADSGPASIANGGVVPAPVWVPVNADASNIFTTGYIVGTAFANGDAVIFKTTGTMPSVTGDVWGETTLIPGRVYYAINVDTTAGTFKVTTYTDLGTELDITSAGTGTLLMNLATRRDIVLTPDRNGAITARAADSTTLGGNVRGSYARDFQPYSDAATKVAQSIGSAILTGFNNKVAPSGTSVTLNGGWSAILSGHDNSLVTNGPGAIIAGNNNSTLGAGAAVMLLLGERLAINNPSGGGAIVALGSLHEGGAQDSIFLGGFHNIINGIGTTDIDSGTGAQVGAAGGGFILVGLGGYNMQIGGAGCQAYWQGCQHHVSHANKDKGMIRGSLNLRTVNTIANGATREDELFLMEYYPGASAQCATDVNTGTETITAINTFSANDQVYVSASGALPGGLLKDTIYFVKSPTGTTFQLSATSGGAAINLTTAGTGVLNVFGTSTNVRFLRLPLQRIFCFEFTCMSSLVSPTTATHAIWKRRAMFYQKNLSDAATLIGSIETVGTDVGTNAGGVPTGWLFNITAAADGVHLTVTTQNGDGAARNVHSICSFKCTELGLF